MPFYAPLKEVILKRLRCYPTRADEKPAAAAAVITAATSFQQFNQTLKWSAFIVNDFIQL